MRIGMNREKGSALIMALVAFIILAGIGAAFFSFTMARGQVTTKATSSDSVFHIAEAGIDDMVNRMSTWGMGYTGTDATYTVIKTDVGGGKARITGSVNGGSYTVELYPAYTTKGNYRIVSTASKSTEKRAIETWVGPINTNALPAFGLFGDVLVDTDGGFFADSYKSGNGTYASQATNSQTIGTKTYAYARANGGLGSNGDISTNNNTVVFGNVTPGPTGTFTPGAYVSGTTSNASVNVAIPPVTYSVPTTLNATPPVVAGASGSDPSTVTFPSGTYNLSEINYTGKTDIYVTGDVTIYVDGQINMNNQQNFFVSGAGSKVKIVQGSGNVTFNGVSIINGATQLPTTFKIESASTGTVKFNGSAEVYLSMYAPDATFHHNGTADFYGAMVADTIDVGGGARFHYDEDINNTMDPLFEYKIKSWKEFVP